MICLLYTELGILSILFKQGSGNLLTVVYNTLQITPVVNATGEFLSQEFNFYISLLFFISLIASGVLIDATPDEETTLNTESEEK